ncbi:A24 family peptidase [Nocardia cyriacigeorgica]|uniref:A24 family peptidase n=1 Tax=Nocardia cyriacigeorgica TaxID=135487 RepID=UPI00245457D2|nr:A24 family peptidase [Nocardia cyriacigeorgica]
MEIFALIALAAWCMALSVSDIRSRRLPDLLTGPGAAVVFAYAGCTGRLAAALAGAALLAVPYLIVHVVTPAAFGAGDVKLAIGLGAAAGMCGGRVWVWAAIGAPLLTAVAGIAALAMSLRERGGGGPGPAPAGGYRGGGGGPPRARGGGGPTPPTTWPPAAKSESSGALRTRPRDSCPRISRS